MKVFVTGAAGFLGRYVVDSLRDHGHEVIALVRRPLSGSEIPWRPGDDVEVVIGDLRAEGPWRVALGRSDAIVHLAAAKSGDVAQQFGATVVSTERLLAAATEVGVTRLVHVSTFYVYDFLRHPRRRALTEASPIEARPQERDAYTEAKLEQERLVADFGQAGGAVTIMRPGFVWGREDFWSGGCSMGLGPLGLAIAPLSPFKLVYVENAADAIARSLDVPSAGGEVVNLIDDEQPSTWAFNRALRRAGVDVPRPLPVPWRAADAFARACGWVNSRWLEGRARLPPVAVPSRLAARSRPLEADTDHARRVLCWSPPYDLENAIRRSTSEPAPLAPG
jgi:2-alkyl-3-oxoalkanoate reductase